MGCGLSQSVNAKKSVMKTQVQKVISPGMFSRIASFSSLKDYAIENRIGVGAFSDVMLFIHRPSSQFRAMKVIYKSKLCSQQIDRNHMLKEFELMRELDHPNILKCFEIFEDADKIYLITEYCEGGNLHDKLVKESILSENCASQIMFQIFSALAYCHEKGIIHRDIKLDNIFLESQNGFRCKIGDFGSSCVCDNDVGTTGCFGTSYYIAPEMLKSTYNDKVDVWSCGILLYVISTGKFPYSGKTAKIIKRQIIQSPPEVSRAVLPFSSALLVDFLHNILEPNPRERFSAEKALVHPWVVNYRRVSFKSSGFILDISRLTRPKSKLQLAVSMYIISYLFKNSEVEGLKQYFTMLDKDNDGQLIRDDFENEFLKKFNPEQAKELTQALFDNFDLNNNKAIDYTEFLLAFLDSKMYLSNDMIKHFFYTFDRDHDGFISLDDLQGVVGSLNTEWNHYTQRSGVKYNHKHINSDQFIELVNLSTNN